MNKIRLNICWEGQVGLYWVQAQYHWEPDFPGTGNVVVVDSYYSYDIKGDRVVGVVMQDSFMEELGEIIQHEIESAA